MRVDVNSIRGFEDAFVAMYISKRSWNRELDTEIRKVCAEVLDFRGGIKENCDKDSLEKFNKWLEMLLRMGKKHITVIRFLTISLMIEGIHRGGQDDIDSHAKRFENKIIRSSTRLAEYGDEMSDYYKDKIITTDKASEMLGIEVPQTIEIDGDTYVKTVNGYIKEEFKDNKDVKRGLYMLSIPSNFVSQISLCEFAHVFKERNADGTANPEVKDCAEDMMRGITELQPQITREYILQVQN